MKKTAKKKLGAFFMTAVLMLSLIQGCSASAREENGAQDKEEKDESTPQSITIAIESDVPTLHPFDHKSVTAGYMNALTYNCLFRLNIDTLEPEPDLCSGYEALSDTRWRFELKERVRFHDGSLMTSEDVVASMEYAASFAQASDYTSFWSGAETDGEDAVIITVEKPYSMILNDLASIKIVPKALIDSGNDFNLHPIGTGPYVFEEYVLGDRLTFTAFEDYFDSEHMPSIKELVWRIIPEGSSRTIALETGEIDVIIEPDANDIARMEENPSITVLEREGTRLNFLTVNTEKQPFDNLYFRKALNAAIDKQSVLEVALNGRGSASVAQLPSVFEGYTENGCGEYDVGAAKEFLELSGYAGKTVIFSCYVYNDTARRTAEVIQACLYEIGIEMTIEQLDYAAYLSEVFAGNYEAAVSGYTSSSAYRYLYGIYHSDSVNAANMARLKDDYVDEMLERAKEEPGQEKRAAIYNELCGYLNECMVYIPLYQSTVIRACSERLGGFDVSPAGTVRFEQVYFKE